MFYQLMIVTLFAPILGGLVLPKPAAGAPSRRCVRRGHTRHRAPGNGGAVGVGLALRWPDRQRDHVLVLAVF
jgi:hypothetical protein